MKSPEVHTEYNYHLLRNALNRYSKNLPQLSDDEYRQVEQQAQTSFELESLVLSSEEAKSVLITPAQLDQSMAEISARYASDEEFTLDLESNGLDPQVLREALYRELVFDAVMQLVGSRAADVNEVDIQLFYELHHERFEQTETRQARHILITLNEEYAENTEQAARARIEKIGQTLGGRSNRFAQFAKRYSECPTAMEGGKLGDIQPGQLFPELDAMLFSLEENEISPVVESEMGFHILWCEKVRAGKRIPLSRAAPRIREILTERRRKNCQKSWLTELQESDE